MIAGISYLAIGILVTWFGWRHWRYRKEETVNLLEAAMLRTTGLDPLPRTRLDRFLTYVQAVLGFVLGPILFMLGVAVISGELGLL